MEFDKTKKNITEQIAKGDLDKALIIAEEFFLNSNVKNSFYNIKRKYAALKKDKINGLLTSDEVNVNLSKITHDLLELLQAPSTKKKEFSAVSVKSKIITLLRAKVNYFIIFSFIIAGLVFLDYIVRNRTDDKQGTELIGANNHKIKTGKKELSKVNVFLDNTGSMSGFLGKESNLVESLYSLLTQLKYLNYSDEEIYLVNSNVDTVKSFRSINSLKDSRNHSRANSSVSEILENVIDSTIENTVSILFSDFIFSDKEKNLSLEKTRVTNAFLKKLKDIHGTTLILQKESYFDGIYYAGGDRREKVTENKPFYIVLFGNADLIELLIEQLSKDFFESFQNSYYLSPSKLKVKYHLLECTNSTGIFSIKPGSNTRLPMILRRRRDEGKLQFSIGYTPSSNNVDVFLNDLEKKVKINSTIGDVFEHNSDSKLNYLGACDRDKLSINKNELSQFVTIRSRKISPSGILSSREQTITISFLNDIPSWVYKLNIDQSVSRPITSTISTPGLINYVSGIKEAYRIAFPDVTSYFDFEILME